MNTSKLANCYKKDRNRRFCAFIAAAFCLLLCVSMGLLIPVLSGFFAYQLVFYISYRFLPTDAGKHTAETKAAARSMASLLLASLLLLAFTGLAFGLQYIVSDGDTIREMMLKISEIVESARSTLPAFFANHLPGQDTLFTDLGAWLKIHAGMISSAGITTIKSIGMSLLGMLLGCMIAVAEATRSGNNGALTELLLAQIAEMRAYFTHVALAQVKISAINTSCTAAYLYVILPLFGVDLSMKGALVSTTFIAGLLPVLGNLIANTAMTIISLDHSVAVAASSLSYLIVIHKFEYIWGGKIIGSKIKAKVWEILVAMIFMEHLFGVPGLVVAPIFYAWAKSEWYRWDSPEEAQVRDENDTPQAYKASVL